MLLLDRIIPSTPRGQKNSVKVVPLDTSAFQLNTIRDPSLTIEDTMNVSQKLKHAIESYVSKFNNHYFQNAKGRVNNDSLFGDYGKIKDDEEEKRPISSKPLQLYNTPAAHDLSLEFCPI